MRQVDAGAALHSAWLEVSLGPRHCHFKDWRCLQAAQVGDGCVDYTVCVVRVVGGWGGGANIFTGFRG